MSLLKDSFKTSGAQLVKSKEAAISTCKYGAICLQYSFIRQGSYSYLNLCKWVKFALIVLISSRVTVLGRLERGELSAELVLSSFLWDGEPLPKWNWGGEADELRLVCSLYTVGDCFCDMLLLGIGFGEDCLQSGWVLWVVFSMGVSLHLPCRTYKIKINNMN